MIGAWSMNVGGRAYGPYTSDRMRAFATEGRLVPNSLVSREGSEDWHEAREEPEFFDFFPDKPIVAEPVLDDAPLDAMHDNPSHGPITPVLGEHRAEQKDPGRAHFAVVVDLKSRSAGNLEKAIESLGPNYRLLNNIWVLSTDLTVNAVRNRLVQELGKLDSLFVIDATRGKAAWFNFGPESDAKIRRVWQKTA
jgi:hypothetical protein